MANSFLNLDNDDVKPETDVKIGTGLKSKPKAVRTKPDKNAVAKAGEAHGFTRTTDPAPSAASPRRGRPPLNEDMTYWRIYLSNKLREELNQLRDEEGRRFNDVLEDMLTAYRATKL
jgi:transcription initiation factor TFIID subunit TAF12